MTVTMATRVGMLETGEEFMISTRKTVYRLIEKKNEWYKALNTRTKAIIGLLGPDYPVRLIIRDDAQLMSVFGRAHASARQTRLNRNIGQARLSRNVGQARLSRNVGQAGTMQRCYNG